MTELAFVKTFLQTLDSKPTKVSVDHLEDPRNYPARSAYILPKQTPALTKRQKLAPGPESSLTVTIKSLRNPPFDITLKTQPPTTSILQLKEAVFTKTGIKVSNIRLLFAKKPVGDSKVLKDLVSNGVEKLEFSVMVIGGAAVVRKDEEKEVEVGAVAQGAIGKETLKTEAFWDDLKGFLVQRLRDGGEGERVFGVFKKALESTK